MKLSFSLTAAVLLAGSACAPMPAARTQTGSARECFFVREVQSFASQDDRRVYVRTGADEVFELQTIGCSNVDWSTSIGIRSTLGGSSVCSGLDAELIVPELPNGSTTCPVTSVRRLSSAEIAALPERSRP